MLFLIYYAVLQSHAYLDNLTTEGVKAFEEETMAIAIGERIPLGWFPELKFTFFLTENVKREREEKDNAWIVEGHPYKLIYTVTSDFDYQDQMCNDRRLRYVFIYSDRGVVTYFPTIKEWEVESDEYGERMKEEMKKIFSIEEEV